jgi:tRNA (guanine37-N1)-methyltransferase
MGPRGKRFDQAEARVLASHTGGLVLVCGRYEGVDERVLRHVDGELSLGDFILSGGELAACAILDAVARLGEGVLGNADSTLHESFEGGLLEYPQYTRPPSFRGDEVPAVLQSGDHARIARWRRRRALEITRDRRPDLFGSLRLSEDDHALLALPEDRL